jgi:hypothetical protein
MISRCLQGAFNGNIGVYDHRSGHVFAQRYVGVSKTVIVEVRTFDILRQ